MKTSKPRRRGFPQTCILARNDACLRQIAASMIAANKARSPDPLAYMAFRDRCEEIGLAVPNDAYWDVLRMHVYGDDRTRALLYTVGARVETSRR